MLGVQPSVTVSLSAGQAPGPVVGGMASALGTTVTHEVALSAPSAATVTGTSDLCRTPP